MSEIYKGNPTPEKMSLTFRAFESVRQALRLSVKNIDRNMRILSVGEGLSDFGRKLEQATGAEVTSLDPIYAVVRPDDTPEEAGRKLREAGVTDLEVGTYGMGKEAESPTQKETNRVVAGSAYEMPFENETFDLLVANHLLEHIDLGKAMPELLRVLKPNGEIRLGGTPFSVITEGDKTSIVLGMLSRDPYEGMTIHEIGGAMSALRALKQENGSAYAQIKINPSTKPGRQVLFKAGHLFVFRKDMQTPRIPSEENEQLAKLDLSEIHEEPWPSCDISKME